MRISFTSTAVRSSFVVAALAVASLAVGCGHAAPSSDPSVDGPAAEGPADAPQDAQSEAQAGRGMRGFFAHALDKIDLRADQKAQIASIKKELRAEAAPVRDAKKELAEALASQIESGAIDEAALQPKETKLANAVEATKPDLEAALDKLHSVLDASQRKAFVEHLRMGGIEKEEGLGHAHMKKIAEELGLTKEQKEAIHEEMKGEMQGRGQGRKGERGATRERMQEIAAAFEGESFDAKQLDVGKDMSAMATKGIDRVVKLAAITVPKLTPEQRTKLASIVRTRGEKMDRAE